MEITLQGTIGTVFRIRLNGEEKKFIGMAAKDKAELRKESFELTLSVKAGDELMFLSDPEGKPKMKFFLKCRKKQMNHSFS